MKAHVIFKDDAKLIGVEVSMQNVLHRLKGERLIVALENSKKRAVLYDEPKGEPLYVIELYELQPIVALTIVDQDRTVIVHPDHHDLVRKIHQRDLSASLDPIVEINEVRDLLKRNELGFPGQEATEHYYCFWGNVR